MDINTINLNKIEVKDIIKEFSNGSFTIPSPKELKILQESFTKAMEDGKYIQARNSLLIGILFNPDAVFINIKKKGIFRYSNYINSKCILPDLTKEILLHISINKLTLSPKNIAYLQTIQNFESILLSYNQLFAFIQSELKYFSVTYPDRSLLKSLLAFLDYLFLSHHEPANAAERNTLNCRGKEEISEAVSYMIYLYGENVDLESAHIAKIAEEYLTSGRVERSLIAACTISDFKEFEILFDYFDYTCEKTKSKIMVTPPFPDFEKLIRFSYIRNEIQFMNDRFIVDGTTSLDEIAELLKPEKLELFKKVETYNYPRYILQLPEPIHEFLKKNIFAPDLLFKEEISYMTHIFKEQLLNYDDLSTIKIRENLNLLEFVKIKRVFHFIYMLFAKNVYELKEPEPNVLFRSLVPVFEENLIYTIFEDVVSREKIDSFLDIVCWQTGDFLDLQYHPILYLKSTYLIPISLFAQSNSVRNLFASEYKKNNKNLFKDGLIDPLVEELSKCLTKCGIENYSGVEHGSGDIDLVAIINNNIIIFECKHTLSPTTVYELRTVYDYIKKAQDQLDRINTLNVTGKLLENIKTNTKTTNLKSIDKILSCTVLSNRMFNGNKFKYPIRNIHELTNFFEKGQFKTEFGNFWLWKSDKLTFEDIENYFINNNPTLEHIFDSLSKVPLVYDINSPPIEFETYTLKIPDLKESLLKLTEGMRKV